MSSVSYLLADVYPDLRKETIPHVSILPCCSSAMFMHTNTQLPALHSLMDSDTPTRRITGLYTATTPPCVFDTSDTPTHHSFKYAHRYILQGRMVIKNIVQNKHVLLLSKCKNLLDKYKNLLGCRIMQSFCGDVCICINTTV